MDIFSTALFIREKSEKKWLIRGECFSKPWEINPMGYFAFLQMIIFNFKDYLAIPGNAYHITSRQENRIQKYSYVMIITILKCISIWEKMLLGTWKTQDFFFKDISNFT